LEIALLEKFSALPLIAKVDVLTRLIHVETIHARNAYNMPNQHVFLRQSNEMVHRIAGYVSAILSDRTSSEQEASMLEMLVEAPHLAEKLQVWLESDLPAKAY